MGVTHSRGRASVYQDTPRFFVTVQGLHSPKNCRPICFLFLRGVYPPIPTYTLYLLVVVVVSVIRVIGGRGSGVEAPGAAPLLVHILSANILTNATTRRAVIIDPAEAQKRTL